MLTMRERDMIMAKRIIDIGYPGHILVSVGNKRSSCAV